MQNKGYMVRKTREVFEIPPNPNLNHEQSLWSDGIKRIAGIDEAGRGAWAGTVVAAAVIFPVNIELELTLFGVRDSKQLNSQQRTYWAEVIKSQALAWGVGFADHAEIDQFGILPATRLAMQRALAELPDLADHLLIDAVQLPKVNQPQTALIKGDQRSLSIAAASILAKTSRDEWMRQQDTIFPLYGFAHNKGYGTRYHQQALQQHGPCAIHRMSYRPLREGLDFVEFMSNEEILD